MTKGIEPILVDKITSGKGENSVFSFYFKKKMIDKPPINIKSANKYYNYRHHLDEEDLYEINKNFPHIFPYAVINSYEEYKNLTINSYIELMGYRFYQLIKDGQLVKALTQEGNAVGREIVWKGDEFSKPELKYY